MTDLDSIKAEIRALLDAKGLRARVLDKRNRYGETVIGVILEKPPKELVMSSTYEDPRK